MDFAPIFGDKRWNEVRRDPRRLREAQERLFNAYATEDPEREKMMIGQPPEARDKLMAEFTRRVNAQWDNALSVAPGGLMEDGKGKREEGSGGVENVGDRVVRTLTETAGERTATGMMEEGRGKTEEGTPRAGGGLGAGLIENNRRVGEQALGHVANWWVGAANLGDAIETGIRNTYVAARKNLNPEWAERYDRMLEETPDGLSARRGIFGLYGAMTGQRMRGEQALEEQREELKGAGLPARLAFELSGAAWRTAADMMAIRAATGGMIGGKPGGAAADYATDTLKQMGRVAALRWATTDGTADERNKAALTTALYFSTPVASMQFSSTAARYTADVLLNSGITVGSGAYGAAYDQAASLAEADGKRWADMGNGEKAGYLTLTMTPIALADGIMSAMAVRGMPKSRGAQVDALDAARGELVKAGFSEGEAGDLLRNLADAKLTRAEQIDRLKSAARRTGQDAARQAAEREASEQLKQVARQDMDARREMIRQRGGATGEPVRISPEAEAMQPRRGPGMVPGEARAMARTGTAETIMGSPVGAMAPVAEEAAPTVAAAAVMGVSGAAPRTSTAGTAPREATPTAAEFSAMRQRYLQRLQGMQAEPAAVKPVAAAPAVAVDPVAAAPAVAVEPGVAPVETVEAQPETEPMTLVNGKRQTRRNNTVVEAAERRAGFPLRTANGEWRTGLFLAASRTGKPYNHPPRVTLKGVVDADTVQIMYVRPGKPSSMPVAEVVEISRIGERAAARNKRRFDKLMAELDPVERRRVRAASQEFVRLLEMNEPYTTADDAAAIEGQISGRMRGSMRAKMLRGAFNMAARDIGEPDVDFTNPIERANPERLRKIRQVILQRAHAADFGFDEGDLSSRMALEDSAGEAIEEALSQLRGAGSIIPDGAPVLYAGDSVGADYVVLRLMYPTAADAVAGRLSYEIAQADGRGDVLTVPADDVTLIKEREDADEYAEDEDVLWGDEDVAPGADRGDAEVEGGRDADAAGPGRSAGGGERAPEADAGAGKAVAPRNELERELQAQIEALERTQPADMEADAVNRRALSMGRDVLETLREIENPSATDIAQAREVWEGEVQRLQAFRARRATARAGRGAGRQMDMMDPTPKDLFDVGRGAAHGVVREGTAHGQATNEEGMQGKAAPLRYADRDWTDADRAERIGIRYASEHGDGGALTGPVTSTFARGDVGAVTLSREDAEIVSQVTDAILEHNYRVTQEANDYETEVYDEGSIPGVDPRTGVFEPSDVREYNIKFLDTLDHLTASGAISKQAGRRLSKTILSAFAEPLPQTESSFAIANRLSAPAAVGEDVRGSVALDDRIEEPVIRQVPVDQRKRDRAGMPMGQLQLLEGRARGGAYGRAPLAQAEVREGAMPGYAEPVSQARPVNRRLDDPMYSVLPMELPEAVRMARSMSKRGSAPRVVESIRLLHGQALGVFRGGPLEQRIELRADIFRLVSDQERAVIKAQALKEAHAAAGPDEDSLRTEKRAQELYAARLEEARNAALDRNPAQAAAVLWHEIGHWIDFVPDGMVQGRGNIFGHIASLKKYLGSMLAEAPDTVDVFDKARRAQIRRQAERQVGGRPPKDEPAELAAWQAEVSRVYAEMVETLAENEGLMTRKRLLAELEPAIAWWNGSEKMPGYYEKPEEMYAEAVSILANNPGAMRARAPGFMGMFLAYMDRKPEAARNWRELQQAITSGSIIGDRHRAQVESQRRADAHADQVEQAMRKMSPQEFRDLMGMALDRRYHPLYRRAAGMADGGALVENAVAEWLYHAGLHKLYLSRTDQEVLEPLRRAGVPREEANVYFENVHVMMNRQDIASMGGMNPHSARQALDAQRERLGEARFLAMHEALLNRWRVRSEEVLAPLAKDNVLDAEMMRDLQENMYYSTVAAVDTAADPVQDMLRRRVGNDATARIHKAVGYLGDAKSPLLATARKDLALINLHRSTMLKRAARAMLDEIKDPLFSEAEYRWDKNTNSRMPVVRDNEHQGTIVYLEGGRVMAFYAPKAVVDALKYESPEAMNQLVHAARMATRGMKAMWTELNYGFWPFQYMRDLKAFERRMPDTYSRLFGKHAYIRYRGRALEAARSLATGRPNELAQDALKRGVIIVTGRYDDPGTEYDAFEKLMLRMDVNPEAWGIQGGTRKEGLRKLWHAYRSVGQKLEWEVKIAGMLHVDATQQHLPIEARNKMVREQAGSPNFFERGVANPVVDLFAPFYNPAKQGARSEWRAWRDRPWQMFFKTLKYSAIPRVAKKLLAVGGIAALFGDEAAEEWKKMNEAIPQQDRDNYDTWPIMWADRKTGKVLYFRSVEEEGERFWGGVLEKAMDGRMNVQDLISYGGGQLPGINPLLSLGMGWVDYASGDEVRDNWRAIVPRDGGLDYLPEMAAWTANQVGAGLVMRFSADSDYKNPNPHWIERALRWPVVSNSIGRFLKVSNAGLGQLADRELAPQMREERRMRDRVKDIVAREFVTGSIPQTDRAWLMGTRGAAEYYREARRASTISQNLDPYEQQLLRARGNPDKMRRMDPERLDVQKVMGVR